MIYTVHMVGFVGTRGIRLIEDNAELPREGKELSGPIDDAVFVAHSHVFRSEDLLWQRRRRRENGDNEEKCKHEWDAEATHYHDMLLEKGCFLVGRFRRVEVGGVGG